MKGWRFWGLLLALGAGSCQRTAAQELRAASDARFHQKPDEALAAYRRALDLIDRQSAAEAKVWRARALRGAADVYYLELRDMRRAVEVYRELIRMCPEAPETLEGRIHLAEILRIHFRDLRGAIGELTAALARNPPQGAELKYEVAKLYFELGDYQQASIEAHDLVDRYETSVLVDDALLLAGQSHGMLEGGREAALKTLRELLERYPASPLRPHALYEMGRIYADQGETERAIEAYVEALQSHPEPKTLQELIARLRGRLVATTPKRIGERGSAFDRNTQGDR